MSQTPHFPIYMDYAATTPVDPRVADAMIPWLREHFGNPASRSHAWGWEAEEAVETARGHYYDITGFGPVAAVGGIPFRCWESILDTETALS